MNSSTDFCPCLTTTQRIAIESRASNDHQIPYHQGGIREIHRCKGEVTLNMELNLSRTQNNPGSGFSSSSDDDYEGIDYAYGGEVTLNLQKGDITSLQKTDATVNFVYEDNINGTMGILDKAGGEIKQQYEARRFQDQSLHDGSDVTMTAAGNLPHKAIFHVEVFQNSGQFENAIYKTLRLADKEGLRSIAFPALQDTTHVDSYFKVYMNLKGEHAQCVFT